MDTPSRETVLCMIAAAIASSDIPYDWLHRLRTGASVHGCDGDVVYMLTDAIQTRNAQKRFGDPRSERERRSKNLL